jgi:hypothetical protein
MTKRSLLKYTKSLLVYDAIRTMFKAYIGALNLEVSDSKINLLVDKFFEVYQDYVIDSFEELDIQVIEKDGANYIMIEELMAKIVNIVASKLTVELLLVEVRKDIIN